MLYGHGSAPDRVNNLNGNRSATDGARDAYSRLGASHDDWRQPPPRPAAHETEHLRPRGLRARLAAALSAVFLATEDENKREILELVAAGARARAGARPRLLQRRVQRRARPSRARRPGGRSRVAAPARGRRPRPRDRGGRARPERAAAVRGRQLRSRTRKPGDRAPARDRQLPARSGARVRSGRPDRALHQQPLVVAQRRSAGARHAAVPEPCLRRGPRRQPARSAPRPAPRRHRPDASARVHHARAARARGDARTARHRDADERLLPAAAARGADDGTARPAARGVHRGRAGAHAAPPRRRPARPRRRRRRPRRS